jgi:hypothetical protein
MEKIRLNEKKIFKVAIAVVALWVAAQITLIIHVWGAPQFTDMGGYISMAKHCFNNGEWYPSFQDVYTDFIWTPGFINYLVLQLRVFGTVDYNSVLNLLLNIAMLLQICYLAQKFFSKRAGLIAAIVFCLFHSNLFIVMGANTEVPFMFLCLSALCLAFSGKWKYIVLAALLFALANWIRPVVIIFLFATVAYFIFTKAKPYNYAALLVPYILALFIIGAATEKKIDYFVYQSTTSGYNLLMVANDDAKGGCTVSKDHFIENKESLTFAQRDSVWKARSFEWIKENPVKFIGGYFLRIPSLYTHDVWAVDSHWRASGPFIYGTDEITSKTSLIYKAIIRILQSTPYYLAFMFFFYAIWLNRKKLFTVKSIFPVIFIAGTLATAIFPVAYRFHYPFMFAVVIYAAWGIDTFMERRFASSRKNQNSAPNEK